jgi:predicted alpha/beta superfamily hydrolase
MPSATLLGASPFRRRARPEGLARRRRTPPGSMYVLPDVFSPQLFNTRDVYVYLPPSYGRGDFRFPVIYMQDGQNLFDPALSFAGSWRVDLAMTAAARLGFEAIVVGVANTGSARLDEYGPFLEPEIGAGGVADLYVDFLLDTLKPQIDDEFRTLPEREQTGIAGSSMGGLLSLYAFFRRPYAFGFAASLSPAFWFGQRKIFDWVRHTPNPPGLGRLYLDIGTREGGRSLPDVRRMRDVLLAKGYVEGESFRYVEEEGARHTEATWRRRFKKALPFLLSA